MGRDISGSVSVKRGNVVLHKKKCKLFTTIEDKGFSNFYQFIMVCWFTER